MADNSASQLVRDWIAYAKQNNIYVKDGGDQPEDKHLADFLKSKDIEPRVFQPLIDQLPEAEPIKGQEPEPEAEPEEPEAEPEDKGGVPRDDQGAPVVDVDGEAYTYYNGNWHDSYDTLAPYDIQQKATELYNAGQSHGSVGDASDGDSTPPEEPEAEPDVATDEPSANIAKPEKRDIERGTKFNASDGERYVWIGRQWANDENPDQKASVEIADELNAKAEEAMAMKTKEPEAEPEPEPTAVNKDEMDDIKTGLSPQDKKQRAVTRQIKTALSYLDKQERNYLKRLLQQ